MIDYVVTTLTLGIIWCFFTYSVNITWGWTGQLSLAPFLFIAVGAYAYGVVVGPPPNAGPSVTWILGLQLPFVFGLVAAVIVAGLCGLILGAIALRRLRDDYFAITTVVATSASTPSSRSTRPCSTAIRASTASPSRWPRS